jgi:hypothetical protein
VQGWLGVDWRSEHVGLATVALGCAALALGSLLLPDRERKEA